MQFFNKISLLLLVVVVAVGSIHAYNVQPNQPSSRRSLFENAAALAAGGVVIAMDPSAASASGGATAGKYT